MDYTPKYLIFVDPNFGDQGHNKFYRMTPNGDTFTVEFGRVGATPQLKLILCLSGILHFLLN